MKFLIISGLSGAGKSRTADVLEDMDFYCVDNLPVAMLPRFAEFCMAMGGRYERVALVMDFRDREGFGGIFEALDKLSELGCTYSILFVEAKDSVIIKRYKETRRPHPLQTEAGSLSAAVSLERAWLDDLRSHADYVIDTTDMTNRMLQSEIHRLLFGESADRHLPVSVVSFGFKYGLPLEADLVFDVRFLPNPFYVTELKEKTGMDDEVCDFIFRHDDSKAFLDRLYALMDFLLPQYVEEGKTSLTIAVGCTGGHHRSVAVARALADHISGKGQSVELINRDIDKG